MSVLPADGCRARGGCGGGEGAAESQGQRARQFGSENVCLPGPEPFHTLFLQFYCIQYTPLLILSTSVALCPTKIKDSL